MAIKLPLQINGLNLWQIMFPNYSALKLYAFSYFMYEIFGEVLNQ